ncbi:MAG: hypothetical protein ACJ74W_18025 [Pyrinomonadaceae bacterium]
MRNFIRLVVSCFVLCFASASLAKEWRGIIPLHSTRADVKKLLGKPLFEEGKPIDLYDVDEGRMNILYVIQLCQQGLPSNWGNWNVPVDTVVEIEIYLNKQVPFAALKIPDKGKLKWYTDDAGFTYYHDKKEGIEYSVNREGMVESIAYGPTEADEHLVCNKEAPKIKY